MYILILNREGAGRESKEAGGAKREVRDVGSMEEVYMGRKAESSMTVAKINKPRDNATESRGLGPKAKEERTWVTSINRSVTSEV